MTFICIPTLDDGGLLSRISMHFGKAPYFTFIRLENGKIKEINVIENAGKQGSSGISAEIMVNYGVDVIICSGLDEKAMSILGGSGVEVFSGASGRVRDAIGEWKIGFLHIEDSNFCKTSCNGL